VKIVTRPEGIYIRISLITADGTEVLVTHFAGCCPDVDKLVNEFRVAAKNLFGVTL
jgi:hypothetical protein